MRSILMYFFLLFSIICSAQELSNPDGKKQGLTTAEFELAKELFASMMESDLYKRKRIAMNEFAEKLNLNVAPTDERDWDRWIELNITKTLFSSIAEANSYKNRVLEIMKMLKVQFADVYTLLKKATKEQRMIIIKPEADLIRELNQKK